MNVSIKLHEINLNVCEEYKTEREARLEFDATPADLFD